MVRGSKLAYGGSGFPFDSLTCFGDVFVCVFVVLVYCALAAFVPVFSILRLRLRMLSLETYRVHVPRSHNLLVLHFLLELGRASFSILLSIQKSTTHIPEHIL